MFDPQKPINLFIFLFFSISSGHADNSMKAGIIKPQASASASELYPLQEEVDTMDTDEDYGTADYVPLHWVWGIYGQPQT